MALFVLPFLLKLFLWGLSSFISLAAFIIFRAAALLIVLFVQLLRVPSIAIEVALEHISCLLRAGLELVLDAVRDGVVSVISSAVDLVSGTATGSITLTASAAMEMMEKMKSVVDIVGEIFPEVFDGAREMGWKMMSDLWDNYRDAVGYMLENAVN